MQLERLEAVQKPNPRSPRRSMMSLYLQTEVRCHVYVHRTSNTAHSSQCSETSHGSAVHLIKSCYISSENYMCAHKQVEKLALEKWGGQEKLEAERAKRHEKRLDRERAKAGTRTHALLPSNGSLHFQAMHYFDCQLCD